MRQDKLGYFPDRFLKEYVYLRTIWGLSTLSKYSLIIRDHQFSVNTRAKYLQRLRILGFVAVHASGSLQPPQNNLNYT